jgi:hypothetical protein
MVGGNVEVSAPSIADISYISRRDPLYGKVEDRQLPQRFVSQWCCDEEQGHAASTTTMQSLEARRRADAMPGQGGMKIF